MHYDKYKTSYLTYNMSHIKHVTHDTESSAWANFPLGTLPLKFGNRNFKDRVLSGEPNVYFHPKISSNFYECIIR